MIYDIFAYVSIQMFILKYEVAKVKHCNYNI